MSDELLPCPFCGGPVPQLGGYAMCVNDACPADIIPMLHADWNRRAPQPPQHESADMIGHIVEVRYNKGEWRSVKIHGGILWSDAGEAQRESDEWLEDGYIVRVRPVYAGAPEIGQLHKDSEGE